METTLYPPETPSLRVPFNLPSPKPEKSPTIVKEEEELLRETTGVEKGKSTQASFNYYDNIRPIYGQSNKEDGVYGSWLFGHKDRTNMESMMQKDEKEENSKNSARARKPLPKEALQVEIPLEEQFLSSYVKLIAKSKPKTNNTKNTPNSKNALKALKSLGALKAPAKEFTFTGFDIKSEGKICDGNILCSLNFVHFRVNINPKLRIKTN